MGGISKRIEALERLIQLSASPPKDEASACRRALIRDALDELDSAWRFSEGIRPMWWQR